jgi:alpha-ketoglutarate-dependent taurine dioxygenase
VEAKPNIESVETIDASGEIIMNAINKIVAVQDDTNVCADIKGFDFNNYNEVDIALVRGFWLQHGVIRFRNANITDQQQVDFSAHFGEFVIHPKQYEDGNPGHQQCHEGRAPQWGHGQ